jgi:response regulator RpfG family c-di-GMP phosphodiesterase
MSIFNPWAEVRKLKAQLEAGYETYRVEETQQQAEWAKKDILLKELGRDNQKLRKEITELKEQLSKAADPRDPKTGRFTKRSKR